MIYMSIWHSTPPRAQDFPIWAYTSRSDNVEFIRSLEALMDRGVEVWCSAEVPTPPVDTVAKNKFEVLWSNSDHQATWSVYDWFKAGYDYGKHCKGKCGCNKGQALLFEDADNREPNESAFDERV